MKMNLQNVLIKLLMIKGIYLDSHYLLTNSFLEVLDVNFVSDLEFNKIGEKNIFIGPYPQSENDFKKLNENGIDAILNLQSDKDMKIRQINYQFQLDLAKKYGIKINRYPIIDFNQIDLYNKLKGAGDLLNNLIKEGKTIYVHCTAGMSRAAATVIIYLVLHENYSVEGRSARETEIITISNSWYSSRRFPTTSRVRFSLP